MKFIAKSLGELTAAEIYEILKARAEIFIVEQGMHYQDMDNVDYRSLHCFLWENDTVVAYLRAFYADESHLTAKVGRVLTVTHGKGHGRELVAKSLAAIKEKMGCQRVMIHAQCHARGFYDKLGFKATSGEFIEEGVSHIAMETEL